jgi:hypothetical protein
MIHWLNKTGSRTAACGELVSGAPESRALGTTDPDEIECTICWKQYRNPTRPAVPIHLYAEGDALTKCAMVPARPGEYKCTTDPGKATCMKCLGLNKAGGRHKIWIRSEIISTLQIDFGAGKICVRSCNGRYYIPITSTQAMEIGAMILAGAEGWVGDARLSRNQNGCTLARNGAFVFMPADVCQELAAVLQKGR